MSRESACIIGHVSEIGRSRILHLRRAVVTSQNSFRAAREVIRSKQGTEIFRDGIFPTAYNHISPFHSLVQILGSSLRIAAGVFSRYILLVATQPVEPASTQGCNGILVQHVVASIVLAAVVYGILNVVDAAIQNIIPVGTRDAKICQILGRNRVEVRNVSEAPYEVDETLCTQITSNTHPVSVHLVRESSFGVAVQTLNERIGTTNPDVVVPPGFRIQCSGRIARCTCRITITTVSIGQRTRRTTINDNIGQIRGHVRKNRVVIVVSIPSEISTVIVDRVHTEVGLVRPEVRVIYRVQRLSIQKFLRTTCCQQGNKRYR